MPEVMEAQPAQSFSLGCLLELAQDVAQVEECALVVVMTSSGPAQ